MFFYEVEGHMPKLSSFGRGKTIRPKKSLKSFLHAALQLTLTSFLSLIQCRQRESPAMLIPTFCLLSGSYDSAGSGLFHENQSRSRLKTATRVI